MGCIPTLSTLCYLINFLSCNKTVEINKLLNCVINQVDEISGYRSAVRLAMIAEDIVVVEGAYIKVNARDYSPHRRGHNVVVLDYYTGTYWLAYTW